MDRVISDFVSGAAEKLILENQHREAVHQRPGLHRGDAAIRFGSCSRQQLIDALAQQSRGAIVMLAIELRRAE